MYYISSFLLIPKDSRVLPLSGRYASLAFRSRQACPANRVTYGLVPEQIVTEKIQLRFLNGGRSLQLNHISFHLSEYWIPDPFETLLIPIPRLVTSRSQACVPWSRPSFLLGSLNSHSSLRYTEGRFLREFRYVWPNTFSLPQIMKRYSRRICMGDFVRA